MFRQNRRIRGPFKYEVSPSGNNQSAHYVAWVFCVQPLYISINYYCYYLYYYYTNCLSTSLMVTPTVILRYRRISEICYVHICRLTLLWLEKSQSEDWKKCQIFYHRGSCQIYYYKDKKCHLKCCSFRAEKSQSEDWKKCQIFYHRGSCQIYYYKDKNCHLKCRSFRAAVKKSPALNFLKN